ncbi:MAG: hypothetical protein JJ850_01580 [Kordiimonadaceae bacterium]|nr:hypothetical protein [Kordiimonadaceae bacterium]MBO6567508.1 hypothetical protein [Kordiimonadaceae bacterium]MBO6963278.1 hypothetical protein [Kordiimonadaceae bacterium]
MPQDEGLTIRLADYVRGTLTDEERAQVEADAAADPMVAAELATLKGVASALKSDTPPIAGKEFGWARLSRAIDAEAASSAASSNIVKWQIAAAIFGFLAVGQTLVYTSGFFDSAEDQFGLAGEQSVAQSWSIQVSFAQNAPIAEIEQLLQENGGRISDGPSAIGLYRITFDSEESRNAAQQAFQDASIVLESTISD